MGNKTLSSFNRYKPLLWFLGVALALKLLYSLCYRFFLGQMIDIHAVVTRWVSIVSFQLLRLFYPQLEFSWSDERSPHYFLDKSGGEGLISIGDGCNGLDVVLVYLAFFVAWPNKEKWPWKWMLGGVLAIQFLNVSRIVVLALFYDYFPAYFPTFHKLIFQYTLYAFIFFVWWKWLKQLPKKVAKD